MRTKKAFDARLPATECDSDMRQAMVKRAKLEDKSLGELQREAFVFFLRRSASKTSIIPVKQT